jgi:hypothetical protein
MSEDVIKRLEELVSEGAKLAPLGGFDFSGYNARLQDKYLDWRKRCLEILDLVGPIGMPYKNRILSDADGGFFFRSAAQLILSNVRELWEKLKGSPELGVTTAEKPAVPAQAPAAQSTTTGATRVLKPPPRPAGAQPTQAAPGQVRVVTHAPGPVPKKVYVIGEGNDPVRQQLAVFLDEIGIGEIAIDRKHGEMIALDKVEENPEAKYAFFIFNLDDLNYALFELGHFVGRLGKNRVCVLHMADVQVPKNLPGVVVKPIIVKLEEASFGILKELKAAGYAPSL